ncbi:MAG: hypothetical protein NC084_06950 [Bacteroides sp.]|nr:hypothetical protein [Eubacterium sp.]MCM1418781.1 hypothetical protein [Roseburia sp.]MCM1462438.1 hypothetical protein [Bacteroides sp.]
MPDFDLDDILAELEEKKKTAPAKKTGDTRALSVDDILNEAGVLPPNDRINRESARPRAKRPRPVGSDLAREKANEIDRRRREEIAEQKRIEAERKRMAEEDKRRELEEARKREAEAERKRLEEERAKKAAAEQAKREARQKQLEAQEQARKELFAEKQRRAETKRLKEEEQEAERKRLAEEEAQRKEEEAAKLAALDAAERERVEKEAAEKRKKDEESERRFATKNIVFEEVPLELPKIEEPRKEKPVPPTTAELAIERSLREEKIKNNAQKLLERERDLDDPDDFLASINPYDDGEADLTRLIETIPAQQLSGDTVGVAGNDLKRLARESAKSREQSIEEIVEGNTTIMPGTALRERSSIDLDKTFVFRDPPADKLAFSEKSTVELDGPVRPDPIVESINKTIERKRLDDIKTQSSLSVTAQLEMTRSAGAPPIGFDPSLADLPRTGEIPVENPVISAQKTKYLSSKRKRKISDFVLEDIGDNDVDDYDYGDESEPEEDEDIEQIRYELEETHKSLRARFILLLIVTIVSCGVTIAQELGATLAFNLFGAEINFLDKRYDTDGFIYFNLICGVLGLGLCVAAIQNGIIKIFRKRADCDSLCAVTSVAALVTGMLNLINTDYLQRSLSYLFIPAALLGLLFNTLGKLNMIARARKNFRFTCSEGTRYYAEICDDEASAGAFTKGVVSELPVLALLRKTEYLTDFLKKSYCEDGADRISRVLVALAPIVGAIVALLVYLIPNADESLQNNVYWSLTVFTAFLCLFSPLSVMLIVNRPLSRAAKALLKSGSTILGYGTAEEFSRVNAVMTDVSAIFPASSVECTNLKPCRLQNSVNNISLDQAIILAASLSIKTGSIFSRLFFEMIGGKEELLEEIEGCVCEDNMGVLGWYGNKRLIMGNREHMKHHSIKVPELSAIAKYCRNGSDAVYLAVGGELTIIFFIRLTANEAIRASLRELTGRGVSVVFKSVDSLITVGKIADLFDLDPEYIKIIGSNLHDRFGECTKYTSSGSGALASNGSFNGFARAVCAAKRLMRDFNLSRTVMLAGVVLAAILGAILALSSKTLVFSPTVIMLYQLFWLIPVLLVQSFRKY